MSSGIEDTVRRSFGLQAERLRLEAIPAGAKNLAEELPNLP